MVGSLVWPRCDAFPPVDGFCVGGHAIEEAGDELDVSAAASGEAELPQFCGGTVVVVDRLIRGIGVDLAGAVAVDLCRDAAEKSGQLRFVVGAHAFARGAPLGFGGHDPDGTVFQPGRPSARAHQRLSRDGCDQQSSRCATLPEAEQTERRLRALRMPLCSKANSAQIIHLCAGSSRGRLLESRVKPDLFGDCGEAEIDRLHPCGGADPY
jgi:hypothetical protein